MKNELTTIKLTDIVLSKLNPRSESGIGLDDVNLKELAASIEKEGVIQPIVVRKKGVDYELVCGERRWRASKLVKLATIPAVIKELTDDQAFDMMITENLQRKDVHPLDEAIAFKAMIDKKQKPEDIALRFGKSASFVALRVKLLDLIPEYKKDFLNGKMSIAVAYELCRISAEDQKNIKDEIGGYGENHYVGLTEVKETIQQDVIHNLSSVSFKKDDLELNPKAGPCTTCPKRSGANPLLFPDIKQGDRCFDGACFNIKRNVFLLREITDIVQTKPEVNLIRSSYERETPEEFKKIIADSGVKILAEYTDFRECEKKDKGSRQGFWIVGRNAGKYQYIQLISKANGKEVIKDSGQSVQIEQIKARQVRFEELDDEKTYIKILNSMGDIQDKKINSKITPIEESALWFMVLDKLCGMNEVIEKMTGIEYFDDSEDFDKTMKKISALTPMQKSQIIRIAFQETYYPGDPQHPDTESPSGQIFKKIAGQFPKLIPIAEFEKEQKEVAEKRKARAKQRIDDLKEEAKEAKKK